MHHSSSRFTFWPILIGLALATTSLAANDWPNWLGPNKNNIAPAESPFDSDLNHWKVAWKGSVGRGYSSVIVAGNRAFTLGHDEKSKETVSCLDAASGNVLWKFAYGAQLLPRMHPGGPNASPTVIGDRVITVSKDGQVYCLSTDKGQKLWQANLSEIMSIKVPGWGFASSPVVSNGRILVSAGKVAVLDLQTGKPIWTSKEANKAGYTTPVLFERNGTEFIAALDAKGISILKANDGQEVARHPFKGQFDMVATTPTILHGGNRIFISSNSDAEMLIFDGQSLSRSWANKDIKNTMNNCVVFDGVLYGIDGKQKTPQCRLVSVNAENGKLNWAKAGFGYGNTIGIGRTLLALTENGELVSVNPEPGAYREISRQQVLGKLCWTTPVYANDRIYVRNDRGDVVCLAKN